MWCTIFHMSFSAVQFCALLGILFFLVVAPKVQFSLRRSNNRFDHYTQSTNRVLFSWCTFGLCCDSWFAHVCLASCWQYAVAADAGGVWNLWNHGCRCPVLPVFGVVHSRNASYDPNSWSEPYWLQVAGVYRAAPGMMTPCSTQVYARQGPIDDMLSPVNRQINFGEKQQTTLSSIYTIAMMVRVQ